MKKEGPIESALTLPDGARFYRCALQVNPFEYVRRHKKDACFADEHSYNKAIIDKCKELRVEVIAVTDHYRVRSSTSLLTAAEKAGLKVFPGFEAATKDSVHLLCLFDLNRDINEIDRIIGDCGIHLEQDKSPIGKYDVRDFLEESKKWRAVCIAAHVASDKGLLATLKNQAGIAAWRSSQLLAVSLPGHVSDAPENLRPILENKNLEYRRERPPAILNAQDVNDPGDISKPGATCWIKMSEVTIEGLRQAFLDPASRIRLASDPMPEEHTEFVAMTWQAGFLDGARIHFNENLNVLVGGRGAGKSTVIESLRYVLGLEALGEEARKNHEGIIRQVLRSGTKISLLVRSHRPSLREYLIERTVPNPAVVRDANAAVLTLTPSDVVPQVEVYGQHELSELTKSHQKLTRLLERFVEADPALARRKSDVKREVERSRTRILEVRKELRQIDERLASLPGLEETLKSFQKAGLEERLKEQSLLVREERILSTVLERLAPFRALLDQIHHELPIDRAFLSPKALEGLPGKDILSEADRILERLSNEIESTIQQLARAIKGAEGDIASVRSRWEDRRRSVQVAYEKILRELQKSKVDGEEFIRLRRQIEELRPLRERLETLQRSSKEHEDRRRNLLAEWEDIKTEEFQQLERAAKKVNRQLVNRVRVQVSFSGNREPLFQLLREQVGGRLSEALEELKRRDSLSLRELADACRVGRDALAQKFGIPSAQAERLTQASQQVIMEMEELDLPSTTRIELNVAPEEQPPIWQALDDLSTGQKATAVLLILLLESDAPLIVDQPEDDLDNRFITDGIVPKMREEKRRRQFLFATHNANIPVLGDAELIIGLSASGEAGHGKAEISTEHMGSIDARPVRELVEEILEGGKEAFEMRRLKYGF